MKIGCKVLFINKLALKDKNGLRLLAEHLVVPCAPIVC